MQLNHEIQRTKPLWRGISHQFACFAALVAGVGLIRSAPNRRTLIACLVYAMTLVLLFGVSAIYHRPTWTPNLRRFWRRLDHASIFMLIAGTYTPVCMLALGERLGRFPLLLVWGGAIIGILQSLFWVQAPKPLSALFYLLLGWLLLPYTAQLAEALGNSGMGLVMAGGAAYTAGALIYALRRPDPFPTLFGYHEIFHALVILASGCHFAAIYLLVQAQG